MDVMLRSIAEEEFPDFTRAIYSGFGAHPSNADIERWRRITELDRTIAAVDDDGAFVATAGALTVDLSLPGGTSAPCAGVTIVSVRPTHHRRGLLNQMMRHQLEDVARRGEPLAALTASETVIYPRYGYGQAAGFQSWSLATTATVLSRPPVDRGRIRLIDSPEAAKILPGVFETAWSQHPGQITRSPARWEVFFADNKQDRNGASAYFFVVHETAAGVADGMAAYRRKGGPEQGHGLPDGEIIVGGDLFGADEEVEAVLWQYLLEADLVRTVRAHARPLDESLRWRLADPRRMQVSYLGDHLWLRVLDVAGALAARRYRTDERMVLDLVDPFIPANDGRWAVEGGPHGARAERTTDEPDLALGVDDLGAIYLGGVAPSVLARAGRVQGRTAGALERADLFFGSATAPWCATDF